MIEEACSEFNNWYRQAGEQNLQHQQSGQPQQPGLGMGGGGQGGQGGQGGGMMTGQGGVGGGPARRPARAPMNAQNGLSFEHVLSRLQVSSILLFPSSETIRR